MKFLTISEAAVYFNLSPSMVRRLAKAHKQNICVSFGQKSNRIIAERLKEVVKGNIGKSVEIEPLKSTKAKE